MIEKTDVILIVAIVALAVSVFSFATVKHPVLFTCYDADSDSYTRFHGFQSRWQSLMKPFTVDAFVIENKDDASPLKIWGWESANIKPDCRRSFYP